MGRAGVFCSDVLEEVFWLYRVLAMAHGIVFVSCRIFHCGAWALELWGMDSLVVGHGLYL